MNRRSFLKCLLGVVGLPAAASMGMDAVSALRPVKEPDLYLHPGRMGRYEGFSFHTSDPLTDNLANLEGKQIAIEPIDMLPVNKELLESLERARSVMDAQALPSEYMPGGYNAVAGRWYTAEELNKHWGNTLDANS